ncbi:MAG TPA: OmpH family outer membrane protein [Chitinophagales bacterium]|jgi:outer membrane protein|nr:OmpH family outer membrane protein [Chitinophagales bacterium]MBP6153557.1 OmpH family outer membrane protein [Chitinophagales bacterium]HQV76959.1 OmpH family outer membrane protein [Chitinophagales bacterium]HQW77974.1 OmpH family outer membrane protein [Chitinophagales bacterium]HRB19244.1 OmpH family outer membrane protein [Chitinophagales bacterium]
MKRILLSIAFFTVVIFSAQAQRFAYVDTKYILEKLPEYKAAQQKLDDQAASWQKEIDTKNDALKKMYTKYQAEEFLLTSELKKQREDEIVNAEEELKSLQKNRFGINGDLFKKRQELIQPIQDKVFDAVQKIAQTRSYDFIFDKASGSSAMLYTNPQYDVSEEVIKKLGL